MFKQSISKKPLVSFFTRERAGIDLPSGGVADFPVESMPKQKRGGRRATRSRSAAGRKIRRRRVKTSNKVRVVAGRVRLRVKGYEGLQTLAPSSLIRFIAATKLRIAARKVLRSSGVQPKRRRRASKKRKAIRRKR